MVFESKWICASFFFFQAEDGIRDIGVTGVQTCALPISGAPDADLADRARREAHKLAGSLGTFGRPEGTDHARAVEHAFEADAPVAPAGGSAADLPERVERLANRGARRAAVVPADAAADRVELVRRGAGRLLPGTLAGDEIAEELESLAAGGRRTAEPVLLVDDDPDLPARGAGRATCGPRPRSAARGARTARGCSPGRSRARTARRPEPRSPSSAPA